MSGQWLQGHVLLVNKQPRNYEWLKLWANSISTHKVVSVGELDRPGPVHAQ